MEAMLVMFKDNALSYLFSNWKVCVIYEEAIEMMKRWYNSDDKKSRILCKWQKMTLSKAMLESPTESEVKVFIPIEAQL